MTTKVHSDNEISDHIQPFAVGVIIQPPHIDDGFIEHGHLRTTGNCRMKSHIFGLKWMLVELMFICKSDLNLVDDIASGQFTKIYLLYVCFYP